MEIVVEEDVCQVPARDEPQEIEDGEEMQEILVEGNEWAIVFNAVGPDVMKGLDELLNAVASNASDDLNAFLDAFDPGAPEVTGAMDVGHCIGATKDTGERRLSEPCPSTSQAPNLDGASPFARCDVTGERDQGMVGMPAKECAASLLLHESRRAKKRDARRGYLGADDAGTSSEPKGDIAANTDSWTIEGAQPSASSGRPN